MKRPGFLLAECILYICLTSAVLCMAGWFCSFLYMQCIKQQKLMQRHMVLYSAFDRLLQDIIFCDRIEQRVAGAEYVLYRKNLEEKILWKINKKNMLVRSCIRQGKTAHKTILAHDIKQLQLAPVDRSTICVLEPKGMAPLKSMVSL